MIDQELHPITPADIASGLLHVLANARSGIEENAATPGRISFILGQALENYLTRDWPAYLHEYQDILSVFPDNVRDRISRSLARTAATAATLWNTRIDWSHPNSANALMKTAPILAVLIGERLIAARLVGASEEELRIESHLSLETLRLSSWIARIRHAIGRWGLTYEEAAPAIFWAAHCMATDRSPLPLPESVHISGTNLPVLVPEDFVRTLAEPIEEIDPNISQIVSDYVAHARQVPYIDLRRAIGFERRALGVDGQEAVERIIASLLDAHREALDLQRHSINSRMQATFGVLPQLLQTLSRQTNYDVAIGKIYERCETAQKREVELMRRRGEEPNDLLPAFDGLTTLGIRLRELALNEIPAGLVASYAVRWPISPEEGGFVLAEEEINELFSAVIHAARETAARYAVDDDPVLESMAAEQPAKAAFLRERLRAIELSIRQNSHLRPADAQQISNQAEYERARNNSLVEFGLQQLHALVHENELSPQDAHRFVATIHRMVTRARAIEEVRRLTAARAVYGDVPRNVLADVARLPHSMRFAESLPYTPYLKLYSIKSAYGGSLFDGLKSAAQRVAMYRSEAPADVFPVRPGSTPADRIDDVELARKIGHHQLPESDRFQAHHRSRRHHSSRV